MRYQTVQSVLSDIRAATDKNQDYRRGTNQVAVRTLLVQPACVPRFLALFDPRVSLFFFGGGGSSRFDGLTQTLLRLRWAVKLRRETSPSIAGSAIREAPSPRKRICLRCANPGELTRSYAEGPAHFPQCRAVGTARIAPLALISDLGARRLWSSGARRVSRPRG